MTDQRHYYDTTASSFESGLLFRRSNRNHQKKIKKICELLKLGPESIRTVLKVGTGTGIHAEYVLTHYSNIHYFGVDISKGMVEEAKQRIDSQSHNIHYIIADGERLSFKDNAFIAAYISGSLHHFRNPEKKIAELIRSIKERGRIAIMEPNHLFPTNIIAALIHPLVRVILKMSRKNFRSWLSGQNIIDLTTGSYIFTPPVPTMLCTIYDILDKICSKVPIVSEFSIMIYTSATKKGANRDSDTHSAAIARQTKITEIDGWMNDTDK